LLRELGQARMFVTVFYGVVNGPTHQLTYARAGHDRPLLLRNGEVLELKGEGVFLGFVGTEHLHLSEETLWLNPGDRLLLYTDGLIDTTSQEGQRFDRTGLHALIKEVSHLSAQELCAAIFDRLSAYQGSAEQFDDMTLLAVEVGVDPTPASRSTPAGVLPANGEEGTSFTRLDESAAREIVSWRYEPPYDLYNLENSDESIRYALNPDNNFYAMRDEDGKLIGFCSFGSDGQVPGGDYHAPALDIGLGIRPDLTGQGRGSDFVQAVLHFAQSKFQPPMLRVTIAAFNLRAQRVWEKNGFRLSQQFQHAGSGREFVMMLGESTNQ
jgi:ribosomal-protein-alanine N-acetyltransferase